MWRLERLQAYLKALAEDCASGAALYFDESGYGRGVLAIDEREGHKYGLWQTAQAEALLGERLSGQAESGDGVHRNQRSAWTSPMRVAICFACPFSARHMCETRSEVRWDHLGK